MKKYILVLVCAFLLLNTKIALAVCPLCTIAVGAGIGFSRWLGVDDIITGLWLGGLIVSLISWTLNWFNKKKINFAGKKIITILSYYILIFVPLYFFTDILNHPLNRILGIDKIIFGVTIGSIAFYLTNLLYEYLKKKNNNRAHFPFQKIVMPVLALIILSAVFYFITK
jgi:hypothetical protein